MDRSKLPKRDKNEKSIWERTGIMGAANKVEERVTGRKRRPRPSGTVGGPVGGYYTNKKQKRARLDRAGKY